MPRRAGVPKRDVLPDPKFNSKVVTKLINQVMYDGKKSTAEGIVYGAFDIVEKKLNQPAIDVFTKALENVMPAVEVKARRVGGSTYQVPLDIRADRRQTLGIPLDDLVRKKTRREKDGRTSCRRNYGRFQQHGRRFQEERRNPSYGRSQQSVCTLSLVICINQYLLLRGVMRIS